MQFSPTDNLIARNDLQEVEKPFLTVAIPHYKHRHYLEIVLQSIFKQDYSDFELVISNDNSPDDSDDIIPQLLLNSGVRFRYYSQPVNLGYDKNVRFCLNIARGKYVFLLGNDDSLSESSTLQDIANALRSLNFPEVAIANFKDYKTGVVTQRMTTTKIMGSGTSCAIKFFRSFSFVSGLIFDSEQAVKHDTDRWDKSIYYQIYLGSRIISSGGRLAGIDMVVVSKDVRIDDKAVFNYSDKVKDVAWSFEPRDTGLNSVIRVAVDGIIPFIPERNQSSSLSKIIRQVLSIQYPFWILEYRRVANWSYSVGIARHHWPSALFREYKVKRLDEVYIWITYLTVTLVSLFLPEVLFRKTKNQIAKLVRSVQQQ